MKTLRVLMTDSMVLVVGAAIKAIGIGLTLNPASCLAFAALTPLLLCYFALPQAPSQSPDAALLDLTHLTHITHLTHLAHLTHLLEHLHLT